MTTDDPRTDKSTDDPRTYAPGGRPRARGLGVPLPGEPGPSNAITDVPGVTVGYVTLVEGEGPLEVGRGPVRTGVTAILPRGAAEVGVPCAAGWYSLNGNGEMTGTTWIDEIGALAVPVVISNTNAIGPCHQGVLDWVSRQREVRRAEWLLPVVTETWDGYLNDIFGRHVRPEHTVAALDAAAGGPIAEGSVGGGTGMTCYGFKGGSGTASRRVRYGTREYTVGVFVQANFGDREQLTVAGVRLGERLRADDPLGDPAWLIADGLGGRRRPGTSGAPGGGGLGSVIAVVATDAPLLPDQCRALARRVPLGLARTGSRGSHFSGDIFLAFSTANAGALNSEVPVDDATDGDYETLTFVPWGRLDPFFTATVEAVEEAVLNALAAGTETVGRDGHRVPGLPHDAVRAAFASPPRSGTIQSEGVT